MQLSLNHMSVGRYVYTLNITTNLGPFFILQSYGYTHRERVLSPKVMYLMVRARRSWELTVVRKWVSLRVMFGLTLAFSSLF